jgi:uncharacterized membrane protein YcjF (UPF0283 family)
MQTEEFLVFAHGECGIAVLLGLGRLLEELLRIRRLSKNAMGKDQDEQGREESKSHRPRAQVERQSGTGIAEAPRARPAMKWEGFR